MLWLEILQCQSTWVPDAYKYPFTADGYPRTPGNSCTSQGSYLCCASAATCPVVFTGCKEVTVYSSTRTVLATDSWDYDFNILYTTTEVVPWTSLDTSSPDPNILTW